MSKTSSRTSLADIARVVGISKATVSYVLRNQPGPSAAMRERVLRVAGELGYKPDARMVAWMARVREATSKNIIPLAWMDTNWEKDSWEKYKFLSPYFEGASERALQLGYRLEKIWAGQPGMTMRRISQIIYQRGIEGVIITHQARHFRLNWDKLAAVAIEGALLSPSLHRVMTDFTFNVLLAVKMLKRNGYRRIGICLERQVGRDSYNLCRAAVAYFHDGLSTKEMVAPLFYTSRDRNANRFEVERDIVQWVKEQRPDVVVGHDHGLMELMNRAGHRVPEDVGLVHLATDDDAADWAGIDSRRRAIGAAAAGCLISLLQSRQFGVPLAAQNIGIRGRWHGGATLLLPKPIDCGPGAGQLNQ